MTKRKEKRKEEKKKEKKRKEKKIQNQTKKKKKRKKKQIKHLHNSRAVKLNGRRSVNRRGKVSDIRRDDVMLAVALVQRRRDRVAKFNEGDEVTRA
ncbi:hypothetical protein V1478_009398 [Vespula squamosa]|uniref:Uncharacterized protein n=1 Tax=Vespula squamosa TaxID=30214 RepID=A0ABD2APU6_VESSQ